MRRPPAERLLSMVAGGGLVGCEDGSKGAVGFLGTTSTGSSSCRPITAAMSRTSSPSSATACQEVPAGVSSRASRKSTARVECMHGGPALGALAWIARHAGLARYVGQQASEPTCALVVDSARHAHGCRADALRGQVQQSINRTASTAHRSLDRQRIGLGGGSARYPRSAGDRHDRAVTAHEALPHSREGGALLCDCLRKGVGAAEVVGESQVDNAVGLADADAQGVEVGDTDLAAFGRLPPRRPGPTRLSERGRGRCARCR